MRSSKMPKVTVSNSSNSRGGDGDKGSRIKGKKSSSTQKPRVFVGQLSYKTTKKAIQDLFEQRGIKGVTVRLLTQKGTNKSRGMAFVELPDEFAVTRALRIHHQMLDGRQINVERTVGGGGHKSKARKEKLVKLKSIQGEKIKREVNELIASLIEKGREDDNEELAELYEKLDERNVDALCTFPYKVVVEILKDLGATLEHKSQNEGEDKQITNHNAYLMGMLKRYREELKELSLPQSERKHRVLKKDQGRRGNNSRRGGRGRGRGRGRGARSSRGGSNSNSRTNHNRSGVSARGGGGGGRGGHGGGFS